MSTTTTARRSDRQQLLNTLGRYWNPGLALLMASGERAVESHTRGTEVFGEDGSRILDFAGSYGVFLVGHNNDAVRTAVLDALDTAPSVPPGTVHPATARLCTELTEVLPAGLDRFELGSSGAEVAELALRAVRLARPDRSKIAVIGGGYHGKTLGALTVLGQAEHRAEFAGDDELVLIEPWNTDALRTALNSREVAAVFVEPVLGGAYLRVPPPEFLRTVAELCAATGTLLVADEIQTGFGRTGRMFAVEHTGVEPDIMLLTKSLTGGFVPVAVLALRESVLAAARESPDWRPDSLNGGNVSGLSVAAAAATIREIRDRELPARAEEAGRALRDGLTAAVRNHPRHLLDAPGIGMMTGLRTRNPAVEMLIAMRMSKHGIHLGTSLNEEMDHPVLRFYPPLTVTPAEIERVLAALDDTLTWLDRRPPWLTRRITWLLRRQHRLPPALVLKLTHSTLRAEW